jgi:hypothetical protein
MEHKPVFDHLDHLTPTSGPHAKQAPSFSLDNVPFWIHKDVDPPDACFYTITDQLGAEWGVTSRHQDRAIASAVEEFNKTMDIFADADITDLHDLFLV